MFDVNRSFESWFSRIIMHASSDYYRYAKKQTVDIEGYENNLQLDPGIIDTLSYNEIVECISELSPQYRMIFNMFVIYGYKHAEIAEELSISVGTSKSNLNKAKQQLKKIMTNKFGIKLEN